MSVTIDGPPPEQGLAQPDRGRLAERAEALLAALSHAESELSIALVDDATMARLNEQYRGRTGPTDVLSFSLLEGEHAEQRGTMLGDVVIALAVADRQAASLGHDLDEELLRLLIHGTLHLLGYDHERDDEAAVMEARERELRAALS